MSQLRHLGTLYEDVRQRVIGLIREASTDDVDAADVPVPACPSWRVRDVVAHLSGLATDIAAGNLGGAATDAWTAAQVDARRRLPLADVLEESDHVGPQLASYLDDFPGRYGAQVVADVTVHEHDIRGALRRPGARDTESVAHTVEFLLDTWVAPGARAWAVAPLRITTGQHDLVVGGADEPPTDATTAVQTALATWTWPPRRVEPRVPTLSDARLDTTPFELLRAVTGRRSLGQIHRLGWSADPAPYDVLFGLWPFTPRSDDLIE